jgi:hypothetical protein
MSRPLPIVLPVLGIAMLCFPQCLAADEGEELLQALKKTGAWESYRFTVEEQPGPGASGALEVRYQKGKPLAGKSGNLDFFRQGEAIVYRDGERWLRSRTGTVSDPLRVLGAIAKVRALRLPPQELADLARVVRTAKKEPDGGQTVYQADLNVEGAGVLARSEYRSVARGGTAHVWVNADGQVAKYTITIRVQGRIGNAEVDGTVVKTVTLSGIGTTEVTVPDAARKALE